MERKFKVGNTTYKRSNYGVGKQIGGKIYVHKKYLYRIGTPEYRSRYRFAEAVLPPGFKYKCVVIDFNNNTLRFDEAPDFNSAREPHVGDFILVDMSTYRIIRHGHSNAIWHHKWMWVDDDYTGFNVEESYQWSKLYTKRIRRPSGSERIWLQQLIETYTY